MARRDFYAYPVQLEPDPDGGYVVLLPDIGYGATQGDDLAEALAQAEDLLEEAILGMLAHSEDVPLPSPPRGRPTIALQALTAERLGWQPSQVTRLFDGRHASRLDQIEAALKALGRRLVVSSEAA
jgi:antitoxin HicB